jgi:hypothetical protein
VLENRYRLKRASAASKHLYRTTAVVLALSLFAMAAPSLAAVRAQRPASVAVKVEALAPAPRPKVVPIKVQLLSFTSAPTPTDDYVVTLIHHDFPPAAWHDAETVAWCESKFRPADIGFDSNGTHDRGVFQLNDGGTEQYLLQMLGQNPNDLGLALNPVLNVRLAALLYSRDGWGPWSCSYELS